MQVSLGDEKASLAALLQAHGVLVKGGPGEAGALMDALMVRGTGHT